jgi:hypothetical protein
MNENPLEKSFGRINLTLHPLPIESFELLKRTRPKV